MKRLERSFFARPTLQVARDLLGHRLVRLLDGQRLSGIIIETEAYIGEHDSACHAHRGRTRRNAVMYGPPGHAYVYFTYGCHWLLNCVTDREGFPAAVLIRALLPLEGIELMQQRRRQPHQLLTSGPGRLTQALAIDGTFNGHDLCAPEAQLFIESNSCPLPRRVERRPRIGIGYASEPWRSRLWNFRLRREGVPRNSVSGN